MIPLSRLPDTDRDGPISSPDGATPVASSVTARSPDAAPSALPPRFGLGQGPAMTVKEFCAYYRMSASVYYRLRREKRGPIESHVRCGVRILHSSRMRWEAALLAEAEAGDAAPEMPGPDGSEHMPAG